MNIYLAARFSRIHEMQNYANLLQRDGHTITSRWIATDESDEGDSHAMDKHPEKARLFATEDVQDIFAADAILSFTEPPRTVHTRGGRHVEFGIAMAAGKELIVVGPRENVFYYLPAVHVFETFGWARQYLKGLEKEWTKIVGPTDSLDRYLRRERLTGTSELSSSPVHVTGTIPPLSKMS